MDAALDRIASYVADVSLEQFFEEPMRMDAVAMNLIVVGEGAGKLSTEIKHRLLAPWPAIAALRHRLAHAYPGIDMQIVWGVAVRSAPELQASIRTVLERP